MKISEIQRFFPENPEIQSLTCLGKSYHTSALTTPTDFLYENQHCLDIMCQSASHLTEDTLFQCGSRKLRQDIQQMENSAYTAKAFRKHHHEIIFYVKKVFSSMSFWYPMTITFDINQHRMTTGFPRMDIIAVVAGAESSLWEALEYHNTFSFSNSSAPCIFSFITSYPQELPHDNSASRKFRAFLGLNEISVMTFHLTTYRDKFSSLFIIYTSDFNSGLENVLKRRWKQKICLFVKELCINLTDITIASLTNCFVKIAGFFLTI